MKPVSDQLAERLSADVLSLCLCWRLERRDGVVIGLTDHDQTLVIDEVGYVPGAAVSAGTLTQGLGLKPGRAAADGVLSAEAITQEDLRAGLWDRCRVHVMRVDWQRPDFGGVEVWTGFLSEVAITQTGEFEAQLVSLKAELERPVGRSLQRLCDANLGDTRCGVDPQGRTCDYRLETCRDVFSNTENYRGFPHLPGMDFVLAGPAANGRDGGKR